MPILTRRELHELVWSTPMSTLAETFGLSDVGLSKICERHHVPTPARGYWAKKEAGQRVKVKPLLWIGKLAPDRIDVNATLDRLPEPVRAVVEAVREESRARTKKMQKSVAAPVEMEPAEPHPVVALLASALRRSAPGKEGVVSLQSDGLPQITIGRAHIERIIAFLHALAARLETAGLALDLTGRTMQVREGQDRVSFTITEGLMRVPHVLTPKEVEAEARREARLARRSSRWNEWETLDFSPPPPEFDRIPSGAFALEINNWADGLRKTWRDGRMQTLESMLEGIVGGFRAHLAWNRERRETQEKREAERRELEHRRKLADARRDREKRRMTLHRQIIRAAREAQELTAWLARAEGSSPEVQLPHVARMIDWTKRRLAALETVVDLRGLEAKLSAESLYPEIDELHDPLGEPPPKTGYW